MGDLLWCTRCKRRHRPAKFGTDRSRPDRGDRAASCLASRKAHYRRTYTSRATGAPMGPPPAPARDGDRIQARQRVNVEVRTGRRPHPNTLPCTDCNHVWSPGERRHEYDHHLGYAAEHHYDVEAVCTTCHAKRARARGELVQARARDGRFVAVGR